MVKLAASLANSLGKPIVNTTQSSTDMEGAYRFIRNERIKASSIAEAGFEVAVLNARAHQPLLALEDTTTISYSHKSVRSDLGHVNQGNRYRGLFAHSILSRVSKAGQMFKRILVLWAALMAL
ncbi:hypothetical protein JYB87_11105 [Shewanella avicenniae]|uniref:Transposase Tn5-like N-terminal domain-containing protein n=1 Tax=Shewanella avicenniae TaxID=2814294 RepID=A0ABX7QWY1_9GAMM|nr:hypothetical protein JYB87_11105 [Shewanella avicenniae]